MLWLNSVVDPWHFSTDPDLGPCFWLVDPDPAIFVIDLKDTSKKYLSFSAYYFFK